MKSAKFVLPLVSGLAVLLSACTSAPVHYRTLLAPEVRSGASSSPDAPFFLNVMPVGIPAQLDQSNLVVRNGSNGVFILESEHWAAPFADEVRSALSAQLGRRLDTHDMAGLAVTTGTPVVSVKLQIRRFDAWPGRSVVLEAGWMLEFSEKAGGSRKNGYAVIDETAPGDYTKLVDAEQQAIQDLAEKIALDIKAAVPTTRNQQGRPNEK